MIVIRLGVPVSPLLYVCSDPLVTTNYQCLAVWLISYPLFCGTSRKWLTLVNVRTIPLAVQPPVDLNVELSQRCVWRGAPQSDALHIPKTWCLKPGRVAAPDSIIIEEQLDDLEILEVAQPAVPCLAAAQPAVPGCCRSASSGILKILAYPFIGLGEGLFELCFVLGLRRAGVVVRCDLVRLGQIWQI